jgi:hypothetical protein
MNSTRQQASIPEQQGDVTLKAHVANVCFKYFRCFIGMLQVFHMNVAKVDRDVVYVTSVSETCMLQAFVHSGSFVSDICCKRFDLDVVCVSPICCKNMFQMFPLFHSYVALSIFMLQVVSVLSGRCICFTRMLQCMF